MLLDKNKFEQYMFLKTGFINLKVNKFEEENIMETRKHCL